jgi:hypothetical protein
MLPDRAAVEPDFGAVVDAFEADEAAIVREIDSRCKAAFEDPGLLSHPVPHLKAAAGEKFLALRRAGRAEGVQNVARYGDGERLGTRQPCLGGRSRGEADGPPGAVQ